MDEGTDDDNDPISRLSSIVEFLEGFGFSGREKPTVESREDWQSLVSNIEELSEIVPISPPGVEVTQPVYNLNLNYCIILANASSVVGNYDLALEFYQRGIKICQEDSNLMETLGYLNAEISGIYSAKEEHVGAAHHARKAEEIRKNILEEKRAKEISDRKKEAAAAQQERERKERELAAERLAKAKEESRKERERQISEKEELERKEAALPPMLKKWTKLSEQADDSVDKVVDIYSGTAFLLAIVALIGLVSFLTSDDQLYGFLSIQTFCSAVFAYFSLTYFFHMWKNISINTTLSREIQYERYMLENSQEDASSDENSVW